MFRTMTKAPVHVVFLACLLGGVGMAQTLTITSPSQVLPALDLGGEALPGHLLKVGRGLFTAGAEDRVAAVARDREQPGAQVDRLLGAHQVVVCRQESVLDGILGLLGRAEHVTAERQDRAVVTVVSGLEARRAAGPDQPHQPGDDQRSVPHLASQRHRQRTRPAQRHVGHQRRGL